MFMRFFSINFEKSPEGLAKRIRDLPVFRQRLFRAQSHVLMDYREGKGHGEDPDEARYEIFGKKAPSLLSSSTLHDIENERS